MSLTTHVNSEGVSINSALIRQFNIARVFHALLEHPSSSQRALVRHTGLDKATVSAVVAQLGERGLIERKVWRRGQVGRPEVLLRIAKRTGLLLGTRLEPQTIRVVATALDGSVKARLQVRGSRDLGEAITSLQGAVEGLLGRCGAGAHEALGMGVGLPALMDLEGRLVLAPNLGWQDVNILAALNSAFAMPVYADNDTKAAALAEKLFGSCRTVSDFLYITGHSGVGGGLFLGNRLYRGATGFAGEVGHIKVVRGGRPCGCGGRGCLEAYVSESALLARLAETGLELADVWDVSALARTGQPLVLELLREAGQYLGQVIADLVNLLNPALVVLGGNLAVVAEHILPEVRAYLAREALHAPGSSCEVIASPLGAESVPVGGAALALEGFLASPALLRAS